MKKLILILHFSFFVSLFSLAQQHGWTDISGNLPNFPRDTAIINNGEDTLIANLRSLFFLNDNEGWLTTATIDTGVIMHTTNGGITWEIQTLPFVENIVAIEMLDPMKGYAASHEGSIFKTTNGGETWAFHGPTFALSLSDMDFPPGSDTGYVCGQDGALFRITPDGVDPMETGSISNKVAIHFISSNQGWVCGESVVMEYRNGEWGAGHSYPSGFWRDIFFADPLHGWGVGYWLTSSGLETDTVKIAFTVDDSSWLPLLSNIGEIQLYKIFFLDLQRGWSAGASGEIFSTRDGGVTWTREAEGISNEWLSGLQFTSANTGYVCGNNMTLLKYGPVIGADEHGGNETWGKGSVEVWPNPTRGKFQITSTKFQTNSKNKIQNFQIEMVDLYGKPVVISPLHRMWEGPGVRAGTLELDISHLPSGIYFVRITVDNQMIVKEIIKL
jgi:photosystem II stability/assembly factor-like uncharacterized protein